MKIGGTEGSQVALEVFLSIGRREELFKSENIKRSVWKSVTGVATEFNEPGKFTAFNGFEWTSAPGGDNLHRVVIFRDGADRVNQVLAIPHNGNTSNGRM